MMENFPKDFKYIEIPIFGTVFKCQRIKLHQSRTMLFFVDLGLHW